MSPPLFDALLYLREPCGKHDVCGCEETQEEHHVVGEVWTTIDGCYAAKVFTISDDGGRTWFPTGRVHDKALDALVDAAREREKLDGEMLPYVREETC